jgi:hypothetical protein
MRQDQRAVTQERLATETLAFGSEVEAEVGENDHNGDEAEETGSVSAESLEQTSTE